MSKNIVIITTGQPSCNPRVVKEADALANAGYQVKVLYCYFIDWAEREDQHLLAQVNWPYQLIGGSPYQQKWLFWYTKIRFKIFRILNKYVGNKFGIAERTQARCYDELLQAVKRNPADYYIGHNMGALPVAVRAAHYHKAKSVFDFEDYHRGESLDPIFQKRIAYLENKFVPQLDFVTAASPLIAEKVEAHFPTKRVQTILNCFSIRLVQPLPAQINEGAIKLCWFSQTIGKGRGLEQLIEVLKKMPEGAFQLHLLGSYSDEIKEYFYQIAGGENCVAIEWFKPMAPDAIFEWCAQRDVGLALETPDTLNRDLCLTNKIFTYLLAGNAILFSNTQAQQRFYEEHRGLGLLFEQGNLGDLEKALRYFYGHRVALLEMRRSAHELARTRYHWEEEQKGLYFY